MASTYATQAEKPNREETDKYLNASGHWTVPAGGGGGNNYFEVIDGKLCIKFKAKEVSDDGGRNNQ